MRAGKLWVKRQWRSLHTGIGHKTGCGYNFKARYFVIMWDGVSRFEQILELDYRLDIDQITQKAAKDKP